MTESTEHRFLSDTFLSVLNTFSHSELYSYRESERGKFDFACTLSETWEYLLNGRRYGNIPKESIKIYGRCW
jgi:hypothetical protein